MTLPCSQSLMSRTGRKGGFFPGATYCPAQHTSAATFQVKGVPQAAGGQRPLTP